jgi:DNA-binding response OmpR family regulator
LAAYVIWKKAAYMKKHPTIMVVDDDAVIVKMLERILRLEGYDVITAGDGKAALLLLEKAKPDLVILDIMMPGLDGIQVLQIMRQHSDVPVIMLTAKCEDFSVLQTLELGADDYVKKPFRTQVLLARIQSKLRRARRKPKRDTSR